MTDETIDMSQNEDTDDLSEILFELSSDEYSELIKEQIESRTNNMLHNLLEFYNSRYKYYKTNFDEADFVNALKEERSTLISNVSKMLCEKFEITIADGYENKYKLVDALYDVFVVNFNKNITNFFVEVITSNKKTIVEQIKLLKKNRDLSIIASKDIYKSSNDAFVMTNLLEIMTNIIPSMPLDFIKIIDNYDSTVATSNLVQYIEDGVISLEDTYEIFLEPMIEREDGYSNIYSQVGINLHETFLKKHSQQAILSLITDSDVPVEMQEEGITSLEDDEDDDEIDE